MTDLSTFGNKTLVVAPHPDDEILGCGGTIARLCQTENQVHVLVVTRGDELFDQDLVNRVREETLAAHKLLGVRQTHFADLPAIKLDTIPQYKLNDLLLKYFREIKPNSLFIPFQGDINRDHQIVHACSMVAARPVSVDIGMILCYETVGSTNWGSPGMSPFFRPNVFVDITDYIDLKIQAAKTYASQMMKFPHERSPEFLFAQSQYRGGFANVSHAEAFMCVRMTV